MTPPANHKRRLLGALLVESGGLAQEDLDKALEAQRKSGQRLGQILLGMGAISVDDLLGAVARQHGIPEIALRKGMIDPKIARILPKEKAEIYRAIPMFKVQNVLTVGLADATDLFAIDDIARLTGCEVSPVQCQQELVVSAIKEYHSQTVEMEAFIESFKESDVQVVETEYEELSMVEERAEGARVINLVNMVLLNATKEGASDIHIEPDFYNTRIRFRIDGVLQHIMDVQASFHSAVISRIKIMSRMDIAERRLPQDGRIHIMAEGREIDVRVSSMPTVLGEKIVMRVLDKGRLLLDVNRIGFSAEVLDQMKALLKRPNGMILVTGPTGSGKTTTLYSGLTFISSIEKNVVSIEDPVEYQLELVNQVQVNEEQGLTFARTLRSELRQDPDVIMVGEIRDKATAEVAIQAALTGHLVLATLHCNDSAGAVPRLIEMGIHPYLLSSSVIGVVAQRLIRLVCDHCKTPYFPPRGALRRMGWKGTNTAFVTGKGCDHCFDSGLRNRTSIFELLTMTDALRECIAREPSTRAIQEHCRTVNMRTLRDEAFSLVEQGRTTLEEAARVVFVEELKDDLLSIGEP